VKDEGQKENVIRTQYPILHNYITWS